MKICLFLKNALWVILLTSCVSTPIQTKEGNENLITPSVTISPVPITATVTTPPLTEWPAPSPQERESAIKNLMTTNAGCNLPCFWGITPGLTEWEDAEKLLQTIGATIGNVETDAGATYHSVVFRNEDLTTGDNFGFLETAGVINLIFASGNLYGSARNIEDFTTLWASYSPKEVINKYGIPSRVLLSSVVAIEVGTGRHGYILWVFYDHLGFMLRYDGTVADLPTYHICPQFHEDGNITRIDLILQSPSNLSPLELNDSILAKNSVPRVILPLEDAAGINTEEFHNLFAKEGQPCFDTPRAIWK